MNTYDHSLLLVLVTVASEVHEKIAMFSDFVSKVPFVWLSQKFLSFTLRIPSSNALALCLLDPRQVSFLSVWTCMKSHGLDTATGWCCIPCSYMQVTKFKHHRVFSFHWRYSMCHVRATTKLTQLGPFWALHCSVQHCGRRGMAWLWF